MEETGTETQVESSSKLDYNQQLKIYKKIDKTWWKWYKDLSLSIYRKWNRGEQ